MCYCYAPHFILAWQQMSILTFQEGRQRTHILHRLQQDILRVWGKWTTIALFAMTDPKVFAMSANRATHIIISLPSFERSGRSAIACNIAHCSIQRSFYLQYKQQYFFFYKFASFWCNCCVHLPRQHVQFCHHVSIGNKVTIFGQGHVFFKYGSKWSIRYTYG